MCTCHSPNTDVSSLLLFNITSSLDVRGMKIHMYNYLYSLKVFHLLTFRSTYYCLYNINQKLVSQSMLMGIEEYFEDPVPYYSTRWRWQHTFPA